MADARRYLDGDQLCVLVDQARVGSQEAWNQLVDALGRVVWKSVNMMTTDSDIRDDAYAATWLRLAERLDTIREPQKLPGWLTTTAVNEVRTLLRQRDRAYKRLEAPVGPGRSGDSVVGDDGDFDALLVSAENRRAVREAFAKMDPVSREILTVLVVADPVPSYEEASEILGRPVGALGPIRRRALDQLRDLLLEGMAE